MLSCCEILLCEISPWGILTSQGILDGDTKKKKNQVKWECNSMKVMNTPLHTVNFFFFGRDTVSCDLLCSVSLQGFPSRAKAASCYSGLQSITSETARWLHKNPHLLYLLAIFRPKSQFAICFCFFLKTNVSLNRHRKIIIKCRLMHFSI